MFGAAGRREDAEYVLYKGRVPLAAEDIREKMDWTQFLVALVGVALAILIAFAMFSTQSTPYGAPGTDERYGPGKAYEVFQKNVERGIHRRFGEIL